MTGDTTEKLGYIWGYINGKKQFEMHIGLFAEFFNRQTRGTVGNFRSGFSSVSDVVNSQFNKILIHKLLRKDLPKSFHMKITLTQKEKVASGIKIRVELIKNLKQKLRISKSIKREEAFQYPITSVALFNYINLGAQLNQKKMMHSFIFLNLL